MNNLGLIVVVACCFLLNGCSPTVEGYPFTEGDCVEVVLDGRQGMVISTSRSYVRVRFAADTVSTTGIIAGELKTSPYTTLGFKRFEVRECTDE